MTFKSINNNNNNNLIIIFISRKFVLYYNFKCKLFIL